MATMTITVMIILMITTTIGDRRIKSFGAKTSRLGSKLEDNIKMYRTETQ